MLGFTVALWPRSESGSAVGMTLPAGPYRYVILDRDSKFDSGIITFLQSTGLTPKRASVQAPWQKGISERWVGSCRREMPDRIIALNA